MVVGSGIGILLRQIPILSRTLGRCTSVSSTSTLPSNDPRVAANKKARLQLAVAYRALDEYGLNEGLCNHLTALAPSVNGKDNVMLVIPYGLHWSEVTPTNLLGLNEKNEVVEGEGQAEITASCIHRGIYKSRPNVSSVMHTHMPYATALACLKDPTLRMVHQNSTLFYNRISYDKNYSGLVHALEEGLRLGRVLSGNDVILMSNHGVLTVGATVALAFDRMYYLERAARVQVLAMSTGKELAELPEDVASSTSKQMLTDTEFYADCHLSAFTRKFSLKFSEFQF